VVVNQAGKEQATTAGLHKSRGEAAELVTHQADEVVGEQGRYASVLDVLGGELGRHGLRPILHVGSKCSVIGRYPFLPWVEFLIWWEAIREVLVPHLDQGVGDVLADYNLAIHAHRLLHYGRT
jgi:hypothetical protein